MKLKTLTVWGVLAAAAYFLLFFGMSERGLVGPDEPRYASITREMAESGDWITPRLHGERWFEKPVLLYWMGAAAAKAGLDDDRATRVPVALVSVCFLLYFYFQLKRQFGGPAAAYAALILGTSAGWVAFSQTGVFDLPLAAALGAALLALLPWVSEPDPAARKALPVFGALLGVAVLAKGLVAPALAALALLPVCWDRGPRRVAADLLHPKVTGAFAVVALPWYLLCYLRNGTAFLEEFFGRHHFERFVSESLQHVEPFWFFIPVMLIGLLPWTPLLAVLPGSEWRMDPRLRFLGAWALTTVLFFSLSTNKLPGYILPALPPIAALMGLGLAKARHVRLPLAGAALLLALLPVTAAVLPEALADGLGRAWPAAQVSWAAVAAAVAVAGTVWWAAGRRPPSLAVMVLAGAAAIGFIQLKTQDFHLINRHAGTRFLWRQIEPHLSETCLGEVRRHVRYGLAYYSNGRLPDCASASRPYRVESEPAVFKGPVHSQKP